MDLSRLAIQLIVMLLCVGLANMLLPRQIPGKLLGFFLTGIAGVWIGEIGHSILRRQFGMSSGFLVWNIQGIAILPSIIGSMLVIYFLTTLVRQKGYNK